MNDNCTILAVIHRSSLQYPAHHTTSLQPVPDLAPTPRLMSVNPYQPLEPGYLCLVTPYQPAPTATSFLMPTHKSLPHPFTTATRPLQPRELQSHLILMLCQPVATPTFLLMYIHNLHHIK